VLTSEEFCIFPRLATRFHSKEAFKQERIAMFRNPIHALECSLVDEKYILLVVENGVVMYDITKMMAVVDQSPVEAQRAEPAGLEFEPDGTAYSWGSFRADDLQSVEVLC
jgi:hypothetical protein